MDNERKLATVRVIAEVKDITGADRIQAYRVDGWWVVDSKGKYKVNDLVVYCEPDSWVPHEVAPFLSKGKEPKVYEGIKGERLRIVKLKSQISQGLLLPVDGEGQKGVAFNVKRQGGALLRYVVVGDDVSEFFGIIKYEPPLPLCLTGDARGLFPSEIPKTAAERIQNIQDWESIREQEFEVTEKIHGSSLSFYLDETGDFHVCSRNLDLKETEGNAYWKAAKKYKVEESMNIACLKGYAVQGELIGEGLNGNQYKTSLEFLVFNIYCTKSKTYVSAEFRKYICAALGLKHAPVLQLQTKGLSVQEMLEQADGESLLNGSKREGYVLKAKDDTGLIIKCISNSWLLKNDC